MTNLPQISSGTLSAIILTRNEAINIERCLRSLDWVASICIVDSFSDDNTLERARAVRPDIRTFQRRFTDFGDQRNWALTETGLDSTWVLFLDADEVCTPALADAIRTAVATPSSTVGYYLCYRNFLFDRWIRHCTAYPTWQLRLLRSGQVTYRKEGHGQREVTDGPLDYIHEPYDHYAFSKGISDWVDRHNRYASEEALRLLTLKREPLVASELFIRNPVLRRRAAARLFARLPCRPWIRFFYLYIWRRGFLDGRAGLHFCLLNLSYRLQIEAKLAEAIHTGRYS